MAKRFPLKRFYLVTAERSTVYRVRARNAAEAEDLMCLDDSHEVDGTTHSIKAELDLDQRRARKAVR